MISIITITYNAEQWLGRKYIFCCFRSYKIFL